MSLPNPQPKIEALAPHPDVTGILNKILDQQTEILDQHRRILNTLDPGPMFTQSTFEITEEELEEALRRR